MSPLTPGDRLRRLLALHHVAEQPTTDGAGGWRALHPGELADALSADPRLRDQPDLRATIEALTRDRDEIPTALKPALAQFLRVSDSYFDDPAVAERDEARLLLRLLSDLGVAGAHLCRCPPSHNLRMGLWAGLLQIAREHARTDLEKSHAPS